ncbi:MAG: hypothetical protein Fur0043_20200 [Anaerolineales bacterium]
MTRILFERSGGFMGRKIRLTIDIDDLPKEQASALHELLEEVDFFGLPADLRRSPAPDEFTYSITVAKEDQQHSVHVNDASMPDDLRPLLKELGKLMRQKR